jgi:hypothetical protein
MRIGRRGRTEVQMQVRIRMRVQIRMEAKWVLSIYLVVINK